MMESDIKSCAIQAQKQLLEHHNDDYQQPLSPPAEQPHFRVRPEAKEERV